MFSIVKINYLLIKKQRILLCIKFNNSNSQVDNDTLETKFIF